MQVRIICKHASPCMHACCPCLSYKYAVTVCMRSVASHSPCAASGETAVLGGAEGQPHRRAGPPKRRGRGAPDPGFVSRRACAAVPRHAVEVSYVVPHLGTLSCRRSCETLPDRIAPSESQAGSPSYRSLEHGRSGGLSAEALRIGMHNGTGCIGGLQAGCVQVGRSGSVVFLIELG